MLRHSSLFRMMDTGILGPLAVQEKLVEQGWPYLVPGQGIPRTEVPGCKCLGKTCLDEP